MEQSVKETKSVDIAKLIWIFTVGSFIGYIVEVVYCLVVHGYLETKKGMVFGPFNQIYGLGAVLMYLTLPRFKRWGKVGVFAAGAAVGGIFEFSCSYVQEMMFGTRSWDFSSRIFHIQGRTGLLYMIFWGLLACWFIYYICPWLQALLGKIRPVVFKRGAAVLTLFFVLNLGLSASVVLRWVERQNDQPAASGYEMFLDEHYDDARVARMFPDMQLVIRR